MFLIIVLALILGSAIQMAFEKETTVTRSLGFVVVRTIAEWTTVFPYLLVAKAIEKARENTRAVVCALVACAAVVGIFAAANSYQMKVWEKEAAKDPVGFARVDWTLARIKAREARGNPCFYETVTGGRNTIRSYEGKLLVLEKVLGDWDRWYTFEVSPDGEAKLVGQRDLLNK